MNDIAVLGEDLRRIAIDGGADLFGIADLAPARDLIEEQGGAYVAAFPRAVSIAMHLSPAIVEQVIDHHSVPATKSYRFYAYQVINPGLDRVSGLLVRRLVQAGFRAYLVPSSETVDKENLRGVFSHKVAAHLAGLGYIGKACLLVTKPYGARVRLGTVLTDAPLEPGTRVDGACGDCNRCVEACPPRAYTGVEFHMEDPREVRFKAHLCERYMDHREKAMGARACGQCIRVCDGSNLASHRVVA